MARILVWVKPGSTTNAIGWDPWRKRWVVTCRAPPIGGKANQTVALLMAAWLDLPPTSVRWAKAGSSRAKELSADGVTDAEAARRLRTHLTTAALERGPS